MFALSALEAPERNLEQSEAAVPKSPLIFKKDKLHRPKIKLGYAVFKRRAPKWADANPSDEPISRERVDIMLSEELLPPTRGCAACRSGYRSVLMAHGPCLFNEHLSTANLSVDAYSGSSTTSNTTYQLEGSE